MKEDMIPAGFIRVSTILQQYAKLDHIDPQVLAIAADRGSRVHNYCEMHSMGLFLPEIDKDCINYVAAFKKWFDKHVDKVFHLEARMNDDELKLSGKCDLICTLKGDDRICLVDIKTPQKASKTWKLQTAAYDMLAGRCLSIYCKRRFCLMLPKYSNDVRVDEHEDAEDYSRFFNALRLYMYFNG